MALYIRKPKPVLAIQFSWATWGAICHHVDQVQGATIHGEYLDEDGNVVPHVTNRCGAYLYPDPDNLDSLLIRQGEWLVFTEEPDRPFRVLPDAEFSAQYEQMELRG